MSVWRQKFPVQPRRSWRLWLRSCSVLRRIWLWWPSCSLEVSYVLSLNINLPLDLHQEAVEWSRVGPAASPFSACSWMATVTMQSASQRCFHDNSGVVLDTEFPPLNWVGRCASVLKCIKSFLCFLTLDKPSIFIFKLTSEIVKGFNYCTGRG